jgi:hypothetical protein
MKEILKNLLAWLWINLFFCTAFFVLVWALIIIFPNTMLSIFGKWAILLKAVGAKNINEFASQSDMFTHILKMNGVTLVIYFVIGLLLQSPLVMIFTGAFYSFIAFLAPVTMGKSFGFNDWVLIIVELFTLVLSISLSSALAGDLFDVKANVKSLLNYWKQNWSKFLPKPVGNWKLVLREWYGIMLLGIIIILLLFIFVAWFETYGY